MLPPSLTAVAKAMAGQEAMAVEKLRRDKEPQKSPAFALTSYGEAGRPAGSAKALYENARRNFYSLSRWKKK